MISTVSVQVIKHLELPGKQAGFTAEQVRLSGKHVQFLVKHVESPGKQVGFTVEQVGFPW